MSLVHKYKKNSTIPGVMIKKGEIIVRARERHYIIALISNS